jgi:hypothetical protein
MTPDWRKMSVRGPAKDAPKAEPKSTPEPKGTLAAKTTAKKAAPTAKKRKSLGGPELKMPSFSKPSLGGGLLKAPAPLAGAMAALRERRMLPFVILLGIALVAVPFLLGNGKEAPAVHGASPVGALAGVASGGPAVAVSNQSGVRDYKKRLSGDAKDPFRDSYAATQPDTTSTSSSVAGAGSNPSSSATSGGSTPTSQAGTSGRVWLTHSVDLFAGTADATKLELRTGLAEGTVLPNRKHKVAAYIGVPLESPNLAWFAIDSGLTIVRNDGKCNLASCGIIGLNPGEVLKLKDYSGHVWMIKLVAIHREITTITPK